jgi:hypothetical protein
MAHGLTLPQAATAKQGRTPRRTTEQRTQGPSSVGAGTQVRRQADWQTLGRRNTEGIDDPFQSAMRESTDVESAG